HGPRGTRSCDRRGPWSVPALPCVARAYFNTNDGAATMFQFLSHLVNRPVAAVDAHRRLRRRLALEGLEERCAPAVLTVNSVADNTTRDNFLSLREAIQIVDGTLGRSLSPQEKAQITGTLGTNDTIQFSLPAGSQTITLKNGALSITK